MYFVHFARSCFKELAGLQAASGVWFRSRRHSLSRTGGILIPERSRDREHRYGEKKQEKERERARGTEIEEREAKDREKDTKTIAQLSTQL